MSHKGAKSTGERSRTPKAESREAIREARPSELVRFCLANRDGAWEEFIRRYADLIYSTIRSKVGLTEDDRGDAFQNAVLAIHQNLHTLRDTDRLVAWIIRIAYVQGVDRIRSRMRLREIAIGEFSSEDLHDRLETQNDLDPPDDLQTRLERAQRVREVMAVLPEACRRLLHLLFYEDPTPEYSEISRRLGIPIGSIGPTRARCLERMRRFWEERGWSD